MAVAVRVQLGDELAGHVVDVDLPATRRLLIRATRLALRRHAVRTAEISITLLADDGIADLNRRFLAHDGPTDVISFGLYEQGEDPVGDIYLGLEQARRQAAVNDVALGEELVRLTVHGVLHVLGFDHPEGEDRLDSAMWQLQESIVAAALTS
jgi:probable rRNA maturation factor